MAAPRSFLRSSHRRIDAWLDRLAQTGTALTQKEIIHKWMTTDLESAIDFSINTVVLNWLTREQKEGMGSFLESEVKER